jgi:hypothetical protein
MKQISPTPILSNKRFISFVVACIVSASSAFAQVSTDSLILYMPMDGDVLDYSGNNNHGTAHNIVADTNRFGTLNTSYNFNGTDSYIEIPASPTMNMIQTVDAVSITAWVNIDQWHVSGNVFSIFERYNPTTDSGWLLEANWVGGGILFLGDETNMNNWIGCNFNWNFDQWYHLGFTYSQTEGMAYFYINGENICASPYTPEINVSDTTASFIIGRSLAGPDEYSDGLIDDYRIYYRVLSSSEVDSSFTAGVGDHPLEHHYTAYPNPLQDELTIRVASTMRGETYQICDMMGKTWLHGILEEDVAHIATESLPRGVYFLRLGNQNGAYRMVKE